MTISIPSTHQISLLCRRWLSDFRPPPFSISSFGSNEQVSLTSKPNHLQPNVNYVISSTSPVDAGMLAVTLAEEFARDGGHVIWIGTTVDLYRMSEQLMFKIAGLELPSDGTDVQLDVIAYLSLIDARAEMTKMWIDFCNVEDCGDVALEKEFIRSMSSFKPTLIVVSASIFDDAALDPFDALVRHTYGRHMVKELRSTNPTSCVLWEQANLGDYLRGLEDA